MNGFLKDITYARSGEYILSIYTRESCKDLWKNFGERPITFSIAKKADPRGLRANSYAWALIEQLAAKLKTDKESVYEEMIRRYGVGESYIDEAGNECKVLFSLRDGVPPRLVARHYAEIGTGYASCEGKLPCVVLHGKTMNDLMASTVRHNRARGKHSINGMSNIVMEMLMNGATDLQVCNELGLEPEELVRLKHITGYAKLYENNSFTRAAISENQARQLQKYRKEAGTDGDC